MSKVHSNRTWRCAMAWREKQTPHWSKVTCKECLNDRSNHELYLKCFYSTMVLNGCDILALEKDQNKRDPSFQQFRDDNYSDEMIESLDWFYRISKETCKLGSIQDRLDHVRKLPKSEERYLVIACAASWFHDHCK